MINTICRFYSYLPYVNGVTAGNIKSTTRFDSIHSTSIKIFAGIDQYKFIFPPDNNFVFKVNNDKLFNAFLL